MSFCTACGFKTIKEIPAGDNRERDCCHQCGTIEYKNPRLIVGTICIDDNQRVLLCKRSIEPRHGLWTLPAGFLENGETAVQGAVRETLEEAGCSVEIINMFSLFSLPHINQIHQFYSARSTSALATSTTESSAVKYFEIDDIPWNELAFPVVGQSLKWWCKHRTDMALADIPFLMQDIYWDKDKQTVTYHDSLTET